jgi:HlyD family secretion protein
MRTSKIVIFIILIILAGTAVWYFALRKKEQVFVLDTEPAKRGYISQSVTATGTIQPVDTVAVGTQVSGTIKTIYADFNSVVRKGQLLAELDKTLFEASVNQYKANLAQAKSELVYQQGNYGRQSQLYKVGAISKSDYDNALYTLNSAKASVNSIIAQLQSAQKNLQLASIYSPINGTVLSRSVSEGQTVAASFSSQGFNQDAGNGCRG